NHPGAHRGRLRGGRRVTSGWPNEPSWDRSDRAGTRPHSEPACIGSSEGITRLQQRISAMPVSKTELDAALAHADMHMGESLDRLRELVAIKSISTDPAYKAECRRAADRLVTQLAGEGFSASARPTPGHPVVVAHAPTVAGPKVVFYAHYDVQPVDPLALWNTDPFTLTEARQPNGEVHLM